MTVIKYKRIFNVGSTSGGGGVQSVTGVAPITVDNTDPLNPIISTTAEDITVVANYSALPAVGTVTGEFYWCSASQGTAWLPFSLGGTYYSAGLYYSNGVTWEFMAVPYQATQAEVNTGVNTDKFVTPATLTSWTGLGSYVPYTGATGNVDLGAFSLTTPTVIGSASASGTLSLTSTSNATKGKINFGTLSVYDEVNDRFGIGLTTPSYALHIRSTSTQMRLEYDVNNYGLFAISNDGSFTLTPAGSGSNGLVRIYGGGGAASKIINVASYRSSVTSTTNGHEWYTGNNGSTLSMALRQDGILSIGTTVVSARVNILSTTEQVRTLYDASNYFSTTVSSAGAVTFDAVGAGANFRFNDNIGYGVAPAAPIHVYSAGGASQGLRIETTGTSNTGYASIDFSTPTNSTHLQIVCYGSTATNANYALWYNNNAGTIWYAAGTAYMKMHSTGRMYFGGSTDATARIHIAAGTATASTAPLKFTSGTNLTTAENGAFEYNGTNLFFTRTGAVREGVLTQSAVTTEAVASDTTVTVNINGTTYKLLARA